MPVSKKDFGPGHVLHSCSQTLWLGIDSEELTGRAVLPHLHAVNTWEVVVELVLVTLLSASPQL